MTNAERLRLERAEQEVIIWMGFAIAFAVVAVLFAVSAVLGLFA